MGINRHLPFLAEENPDLQQLVRQIDGPETKLQRLERLTGINPCLCSGCKTGHMVIVKVLSRIRSPGLYAYEQSLKNS